VPGPHTVAVFVVPDLAVDVAQRSADQHVWALRSPAHERVAQQLWAAVPTGSLERGVTLFNGVGLSAEEELLGILGVIEEHHGTYHEPPVSVIEVFGSPLTPDVEAEFAGYGFTRFTSTDRGFVACREAA
jgi:hypothetical protein